MLKSYVTFDPFMPIDHTLPQFLWRILYLYADEPHMSFDAIISQTARHPKNRRARLRKQRRCERSGSRLFSQTHRANGATVTEARLHQPISSSLHVVPGRALRHRPTKWIGSSPLPQPMCYLRQAKCVNSSVRMSLDPKFVEKLARMTH